MKNNISMEQIDNSINNILMTSTDKINNKNLYALGLESFNEKFKEAFDKIGNNGSLLLYHKHLRSFLEKMQDNSNPEPPIQNHLNQPKNKYDFIRNFTTINQNTFSIMFNINSFIIGCFYEPNGLKVLYNDIYLLNELNKKIDDVTVYFFCNWNEYDAPGFYLSYPMCFLNLITEKLNANKIGYLDSTNNLFGYYFLSKCNKINLGEFGSIIINRAQYVNDFTPNVIAVIEDNYTNIFTELANKDLITADEIIQLKEEPVKPIIIDHDELQRRVDIFNARVDNQ